VVVRVEQVELQQQALLVVQVQLPQLMVLLLKEPVAVEEEQVLVDQVPQTLLQEQRQVDQQVHLPQQQQLMQLTILVLVAVEEE
jgi:hypothetical protein